MLKGPQALFFGKESPGGVISLNTADPTDQFEMSVRAGYEFESVQPRAEFIVSGPVTDTLKLRLATMYDQEQGYFHNDAIAEPGTGAAPPGYDRAPWGKESLTRITALWDPTPEFSAKLKINEAYDRYSFDDLLQFTACPSGTAHLPGLPSFIGGGENCLLDTHDAGGQSESHGLPRDPERRHSLPDDGSTVRHADIALSANG